jgi:uncharacterized ion transporter superfamily protein YfcC
MKNDIKCGISEIKNHRSGSETLRIPVLVMSNFLRARGPLFEVKSTMMMMMMIIIIIIIYQRYTRIAINVYVIFLKTKK